MITLTQKLEKKKCSDLGHFFTTAAEKTLALAYAKRYRNSLSYSCSIHTIANSILYTYIQ